MKRIIPHIPNITASASVLFASVVVFASAFLLSGCSESELPGDDDNGNNNRPAFTIEVSDGGYAPSAGEKSATRENPATRATENGYTTQFTAGDKIGVYAVKDGAIVDGVNNLCLVATTTTAPGGTSTSLVWQTTDGNALHLPAGATYYAYYPWQSGTDMANKVTASASTAAAFFANVISNWSPSKDQGTYAAYASSDLMIAKGTTSNKKLSFPMQHQMALVVIDLPRTKYTLTDASGNSLPDYILDAPDTKFNVFTPCRMGDGTYRYLINPAATGSQSTTLSGSYTNATPATAEWELTANVPASQYKKYVVDNATVNTKSHQLQVGDFFMKDGTLLSKTEELSDEEKAACIGIVYWVGDPTKPLRNRTESNLQGDKTLAKEHPGCMHGLVVSLGEESCAWQASQTSVQDWLNSNRSGDFLSVQSGSGASDPLNNIQGYNNTKAIEAFNESSDNSGNQVYVVQKVVDYRTKVPAPAASSGWYVPSGKELTLLCGTDVDNIYTNKSGGIDNRDLINRRLKLISSATTLLSSSSLYWSSTETSYYAIYVDFGNGNVGYYYKYRDPYRLRFSFAF